MEKNLADTVLALPLHEMATMGFYIIAMIYIVFSAILYYHWKEYSIDDTISKITLITYLITTIPLILAMGITTLVI